MIQREKRLNGTPLWEIAHTLYIKKRTINYEIQPHTIKEKKRVKGILYYW